MELQYSLLFLKWCDLINAQDAQTSSLSCKILRCPISNMTSPRPTCRFWDVWMRYPLLLVIPQKWAQDRGEDKVGREGTYLKVVVKRSVLVWNNRKSQSIILHAPGCALPEMSINQVQEILTKLYSMFAEFFKVSDRVHAYPSVATPQQR